MCITFFCCRSERERKVPEIDIENQSFVKKYDTQLDFYKALKDRKVNQLYQENKSKKNEPENIIVSVTTSFYIEKEVPNDKI
jgi:hypothetical protein